MQTQFNLSSGAEGVDAKSAAGLITEIGPMLRAQLSCANLAELRGGFFFLCCLITDAYLVFMALVLHLWWEIGAWHVQIDLTEGAAVGEGAAGHTTAVAQEGAAAVGGIRHQDERVLLVGRVLHKSVCIAAVFVEEELAAPAGENRVMAEAVAAVAVELLPWLDFV
ncbi:hypothetical protein SASPL_107073 [Salvia splendens]|uniref:Uncharacterized protein n=1 Tax=Salvia splendens TaxID=180675 RepID=A0A8X8YCA9_SALSN|nr:hypothetical protein SASPL_107073 [Salvia splendens]